MADIRDELELAQGEALLLRHLISGRVLYGLSGMAWVTQEGDSRDHVLGPGGVFRAQRFGRVVVQALRHSRLLVTSPGEIERLEALKAGLNETARDEVA